MKDNPNEKIKQTSEVHWGTDDYCIIKLCVEDGQEPYYFPQTLKDGTWEYIHCNQYSDKTGIERIYTIKKLRVNMGSSHKYVEIGCHQVDFAHELIKCHKMGLSKYMAEKKAEREGRESRIALDTLSLPELHSLHDLLDRGIVDGNSSHTRAASLVKIRRAIRVITKKINY